MFTCKGCTEVARLVGEVEDLRKMMESLKRMFTGQGLEEKGGETGDQEATLEEAEEKEHQKCVGEKTRYNSSTDNMYGKKIRPGAQMLATHDYKKNPESPVGNELDVNEEDTLVYLMTNENNEHWRLTEDGKGQVGYVPAAYMKIIRYACDPPGRGKRHSQERRVWKEDRWNQDWRGDTTGWRKKKDVFSGSDRGIQEELGDLCRGLHS